MAKRTEFEGRTYDVETDETKRTAPLEVYCQVYRVRKDGTRGQQIHTGSIIFAVLQASRKGA